MQNNAYIIPAVTRSQLTTPPSPSHAEAFSTTAVDRNPPQLWHRHLGHPGKTQLAKLIGLGLLDDCPLQLESLQDLDFPCNTCALGKARKTPFPATPAPASRAPLELVHSDVMGPFTPLGIRGEKYIVTLLDDYSGLGEVYPIQKKSDVFVTLRTALVRWGTIKLGLPVRAIRTDRGGEFISTEWDAWLEERQIVHQTSLPHSPQQSGKAERYNGVLIVIARTLMIDSGLTKGFWPYAFTMAAYLHSLHLHSAKGLTHFQLFHGYRPSVKHLRVFGALCYPTRVTKQPKLSQTADAGKLLGYGRDSVGYVVWLPKSQQIVETCNVLFYESGYPVFDGNEPFSVAVEGGDSSALGAPVSAPMLAPPSQPPFMHPKPIEQQPANSTSHTQTPPQHPRT